ncbi:polysaccharide deacetylase family protein [Candidatus Woesearchaeota archaeon]|nr:polysaccharide deacetylase family protein [Candidatus Woesearchaeota archaeon]
MQKNILLTFDTEEFDALNGKSTIEVSTNGLNKIIKLLDKHDIKATFFVTGIFAEHNKLLIKKLSKKHEIASHGYSHSSNYNKMNEKEVYNSLLKTNNILKKIINKKIMGYRSPRFSKIDLRILKKLDFKYDSSVNPTFVPGRYNYLSHTRKITIKDNIAVIPMSVSPLLRLPLFWFAFKNFGLIYSKLITKICLLDQDFVHLVFHPWEFEELSKYNISFIYKLNSGSSLIKKLDNYIVWCKRNNMKFDTVQGYLINGSYIK